MTGVPLRMDLTGNSLGIVMVRKTFKREIAVALMVWLVYLVETKDIELVKVVVWPILTWPALAFGMDWHGKQSTYRKPSGGSKPDPDGMRK